jgi:hypothetical protein
MEATLLKFEILDRSIRLRHELRVTKFSRPQADLLHLSHAGGSSDVYKTIREEAVLMQQRLQLEMQE